MEYSKKAKVTIILGIGLIAFVASLVSLPFLESGNGVQKISESSIKKVDDSEAKMLDVIAQEKAELEWKIGGKLMP